MPRPFFARWAFWIVLASLLLTGFSTFYAIKLYANLRTDFEELLPTQSRSVKDLAAVEKRMESAESLAILVFSDHPDESKRWVVDLSNAIQKELGGLYSRVEYRIDREIQFFDRRRALMMDLPDLRKVQNYIDDRLDYEHEIRNPLNIFSGETINPPSLDMHAMTSKYEGKVADYAKFKDGFYATPDGKIRAILVYVSGRALGVTQALKLRSGIDGIVARLKPTTYAPDLKIGFTGDVENLIEERNSIVSDLELSTVVVALLVIIALAIYYRNLLATAALVISLFAGTLWTFGAAYFAVGYLNANSAFLGSIVMGNGINFGIVLLARYLEERRTQAHPEALTIAMKGALPGTLTAALAAALAYGSLGLTTFRGFRQFGVIGLMGMVLCWIASFTLLPALLTLFEKIRPIVPHGAPPTQRHGFASLAARAVGHHPRKVLATGLAVTLILGALAAGHRGPILETDTSKLRDRRSLQEGSGYLSKYLDQLFGRYMSPLVILPQTREHSLEIARRLRQLHDQQGKSSLIANVYSIDDFVPHDQPAKIKILRAIRHELKPEIVARLSSNDAKLVKDSFTPESMHPFTIDDLPPAVRARFREADGAVGRPVLLEPIFDELKMSQFENQKKIIDEVRATADSVEPGVAVVGQLPLTVDMIGSISHDGPRATLFAFLAVTLLAILLFRRPVAIFQSVLALLLGVFWMVCAALALKLKINFLNFIALPITFGIGVDYGVNILARVRRDGADKIVEAIETTGGAVTMASLTTIIGYSSLLIAGNQGFVSFGRLAVLGEVTCLSAALFMLPAFLKWLALRKGSLGDTPAQKASGSEANPAPKQHAA